MFTPYRMALVPARIKPFRKGLLPHTGIRSVAEVNKKEQGLKTTEREVNIQEWRLKEALL